MRTGKSRRGKTEYWVFERGVLVRADGRPIVLKSRKTAERLISEMGMAGAWTIEEAVVPIREMRGRKGKKSEGLAGALLAWSLMRPEKRPKRFEDQRAFMARFGESPSGNPVQRRKAVRAFVKQIQRLHRSAEANPSIDKLLS